MKTTRCSEEFAYYGGKSMPKKILFVFLAIMLVLSVVAVAACAKEAPAPAPAPMSPAEFYGKNTAVITDAWAAGTGTDFIARLFASFWSDFMGGSAVVKNIIGGGGLVCTNQTYKAKPDGLTLQLTAYGANLAGPKLFKLEGVEYDITKFGYIGMIGDEAYVLAIGADLPYNTVAEFLADPEAKKLKFGCTSKAGGAALGTAMGAYLLGLPEQSVISGYSGSVDVGLNIGRGEIAAMAYQAGTIKREADKGFVKPLVTIDTRRNPMFPDIPAITEVIDLTPEQKKTLEVYNFFMKSGYALIMSPGVPKDRLEYVRAGFDKMVADKGFLSMAKMRFGGAMPPPVSGKDLEKLILNVGQASEEDIAILVGMGDKYIK